MSQLRFPYHLRKSSALGLIARPLLRIRVYSPVFGTWLAVDNVLADTGADFTIFPRWLARGIVGGSPTGRSATVGGIVPDRYLSVSLTELDLCVGPRRFRATVGIASTDGIPPILGRYQALDRFRAVYRKGKSLILEW